jgi:hypothetical protein
MQHLLRSLSVLAGLAALAPAQIQTILFTGRFPFKSLDAANERPNGAITRLEEFDFSYVTPGPGAGARTLFPATAMQCYLGDGNADGNHLKFNGFKTYFEALQIGGLFVKSNTTGGVQWTDVYFTVRDNVATKQFEVLTNNGTVPAVLAPGDWVRLLPNGNVEFFMTAAQLAVAAGAPPATGSSVPGAHALLQTATGDLYSVPVQGGQWVSGNAPGTPVFAQDGAICKIDAINIAYDAAGNIASFAPNSARLIIDEVAPGPLAGLTTRQMVLNSGGFDRTGNAPLAVAGIFGKLCGIGVDPNGGTFTSTFPDALGNYTTEPNFVFCSDAGSYGGTIFSTASNGSLATINGVLCGSNTLGVPADGNWLGVSLDVPNFQPSLMSLCLVDFVANQPLIVDQNGFGSLPAAATQPSWDIDVGGSAFTPVFLFLSTGPTAPGSFAGSVPTPFVPLPFTGDSWDDVFLLNGPFSLGFAITDAFGYGTVSTPNPNNGSFAGFTLVVQGVGLVGSSFQLTTPMLVQLQ